MIRYAAFDNFVWLWLVPVLALVLAYSIWRRQRVMEAFIGPHSVTRLAGNFSVPRVIGRVACVVTATGLIVFALAQPQWGKYWTQQRSAGRDIMVALDVSRSMLADDVTPSRLERAKADVLDLVAAVEEAGGHRLGLIAFAGSPSLKCPLTQVTNHFKLVLDAIDARSVPQGGTMIGDCIREAIEAFDDKTQNFRDLILITDGEDMDSFPVEAAAAARDAGITIYTIGIGDSNQGSRIPVSDKSGRRSYLEYQGEVVWSKLDERSLKEIAQITGGIYIPAGTRAIELDRIFRDVIEPKTKREMAETRRERLQHRFQWFLAPALLLLMVEMLIRDTRKRTSKSVATGTADEASTATSIASPSGGRQSLLPIAAIALAVLLAAGHEARAADAGSVVREGNSLYDKGKYAEAAEKFAEASRLAPESPIPLFNQASALFQSGDYAQAVKLYEQSRVYAPDDLRRKIDYALGNCHLQQAMQSQAQPNVASQQAKQATQFYRDVIAAQPNRTDADSVASASRYNMELAKRLIQLMQEKQDQKQQEQQQGEEKNNSEHSQQNSEQKKQDGKENQGSEQDQSKDKQDQKGGSQEQQSDGKEQQPDQGQQGGSKEEQAQPFQGEGTQKLSPDEASDRLRAAIARAQVARSRRLSEQNKQVKARPGVKDW